MSRTSILLSTVAFLIAAHDLPAPIVEEEKPTPAPEQSAAPKPKAKRQTKPAATSEEQAPAKTEARAKTAPPPAALGPARFAGTWTGKINQGVLGHVRTNLTIDATATSIELSHNLGGGSKRLAVSGNSASWKSGAVGEIAWTLSPNSDGQTAQVTMKGLLLSDTTTFRRGQPVVASPSPARR
jgi:hypothetical protein